MSTLLTTWNLNIILFPSRTIVPINPCSSAHQALHYGPLYRNIHKLHHRYSAPFGLAAEFAHPAEILILGMGTIGGPLLYCYLTQNLHIVTVYIWVCMRLHQAVDAHSGYDFPWSLRNIFPLWSGAEHHDFHHMAFTNVSLLFPVFAFGDIRHEGLGSLHLASLLDGICLLTTPSLYSLHTELLHFLQVSRLHVRYR